MWVYLIVYSIGRFVIEQIRLDSATVGDLKTPAVVAIITIVFSWTMLIYRHRPSSTAAWSEANLPDDELQALHPATATATASTNATAAHESRVRRVHALTTPPGTPEPPATPEPTVDG